MSTQDQQPAPITSEEIFAAHEGGKLSVVSKSPLATRRDLSIAYTPGVAEVSRAVAADPAKAHTHTWAGRLVAVVSDGSAVLGLGDIGPAASLPVMEGKAALFKEFGGLDSIPIVLDTQDVDEIVRTVKLLRPSFGAVNLEDIAAPRCFEIEARLIEELDIPVMHDDQHGTAVVVLAALLNAAALVGKDLAGLKVVIAGAGAAGIAITEILLAQGIEDVVLMDSRGIVSRERDDLNEIKAGYAARTNPRGLIGGPKDALQGADVFVGVSGGKIPEEHLTELAEDAIVFALANPDPEIMPDVAAKYASVVATGRSDFPNQINNVLAFPGIFRGALDAGARRITAAMKLAAAKAIAAIAEQDGLAPGHIVPSALDPRVAPAVAEAVAAAAQETGTAQGAATA
ncbi:NAD-dependent malic enzyme [Kocuria sp. LUK]|uniref:NAD(P)-dependent malic enzyme n=1 Tax=Kocuria sp. LUK TaxID=2897828 RepID=UPI001E2BC9D6|nr:malic enzyme-like NAD(P)-binding protein [Kocuria sp. LUK]MCD1144340.1 NAD-dependent malic enzyme [Kocuria sp. LUK]